VPPEIKVFLVGGTSHVGKSTLAARLAAAVGWTVRSTDRLARHPGRPWRDDRSRLPDDVVAHYSSESASGLVDSVLRHYRRNVWPIADALVRSHLDNPFDPGLVLEGSAILPEAVCAAGFEGCGSVWLTASDDLIRERIFESSRYSTRSPGERKLIDAFVQRALDLDQLIIESAGRLGQRRLDVGASDVMPELLRLARSGEASAPAAGGARPPD
jgi:2-phosphoglycerate kinase